jgi:hypothetical protein
MAGVERQAESTCVVTLPLFPIVLNIWVSKDFVLCRISFQRERAIILTVADEDVYMVCCFADWHSSLTQRIPLLSW